MVIFIKCSYIVVIIVVVGGIWGNGFCVNFFELGKFMLEIKFSCGVSVVGVGFCGVGGCLSLWC